MQRRWCLCSWLYLLTLLLGTVCQMLELRQVQLQLHISYSFSCYMSGWTQSCRTAEAFQLKDMPTCSWGWGSQYGRIENHNNQVLFVMLYIFPTHSFRNLAVTLRSLSLVSGVVPDIRSHLLSGPLISDRQETTLARLENEGLRAREAN